MTHTFIHRPNSPQGRSQLERLQVLYRKALALPATAVYLNPDGTTRPGTAVVTDYAAVEHNVKGDALRLLAPLADGESGKPVSRVKLEPTELAELEAAIAEAEPEKPDWHEAEPEPPPEPLEPVP